MPTSPADGFKVIRLEEADRNGTLMVRSLCQRCGFTFDSDLNTVNVKELQQKHVEECPVSNPKLILIK
jgi:hypothetical protein